MQITYALANVYDDSPDLEVRVTDEHRARAEDMMTCVESGDVGRLRDAFLEVGRQAAAAAADIAPAIIPPSTPMTSCACHWPFCSLHSGTTLLPMA